MEVLGSTFSSTALVDVPAVCMPLHTRSVALCCVIELHVLILDYLRSLTLTQTDSEEVSSAHDNWEQKRNCGVHIKKNNYKVAVITWGRGGLSHAHQQPQ